MISSSSTTKRDLLGLLASPIVKEAEPDLTQFDPESNYFDPKPLRTQMGLGDPRAKEGLKFVSLDELRAMPEFEECRLLA